MNEAFFTTEGKLRNFWFILLFPKNLRRNGKRLISINRRTDKEDMVHKYNIILLGPKTEQNNAIHSNMAGLRDGVTSDINIYLMILLISRI